MRDIASLQQLLEEISQPDLALAADLLEKAEIVYLIGQLRSAPVVELLRYVLTMLGRRCVLLDPGGGLATHMGRAIGKNDVLLAVSFRFYAAEVVNIVEEAGQRGIDIIAIGKGLEPHDAYDTGVFAIGPALFAALGSLGHPSLTDGVRLLAGEDRAFVADCSDLAWIDVDDAPALAKAEQWRALAA